MGIRAKLAQPSLQSRYARTPHSQRQGSLLQSCTKQRWQQHRLGTAQRFNITGMGSHKLSLRHQFQIDSAWSGHKVHPKDNWMPNLATVRTILKAT